MQSQPRFVSFILALLIAVSTSVFCSQIPGTPFKTVLIVFLVALICSFVLIYFTFKNLIFSELYKLDGLIDKLKKKDFKISRKDLKSDLNPIQRLNDEISFFAAMKENEIEELKKLETYRREFIADVSHELKNPIFAAQGFIHTLIDGAIDDPEVNMKFLKKAAKSLDGLDELVQDLLTLSEIETGSAKMKKKQIDLFPLVNEVFDQLEKKAAKRNISLSTERNVDFPIVVNADPARIFQAIQNLVENGIKYGKEGGFVRVRLRSEKEYVEIEVADNGPGITVDDQKRIFERFYRIEKSRSKEKGGSGLGLAIVKHIIEAHKSKIKVYSNLEVGTNFSFKLYKKSAN